MAEIPYRLLGHLQPVGHGDNVLRVVRQIAGPFLQLIGLHLAIEKDDSFLDPDLWVGEPVGGIQNTLESLADLFIVRDGFYVYL